MTPTPEPPIPVGQQLRQRREELDLTQEALAQRIGITAATVSVTERGQTEIRRSKRPAWERALQLKAGTISRAYKNGTPLEPADSPTEPPYADMSNPKEAAVWAMPLSEADRRELIDLVRQQEARKRRRGQQSA